MDILIVLEALFGLIAELKRTPRDAWDRRGCWYVPRAESVGCHSWGMGMLAVFVPVIIIRLQLDSFRLTAMCLIHDIVEVMSEGDINIYRETNPERRAALKARKKELELASILRIRARLGPVAGEFVYQLWLEYEAGVTPEAKLAKEFDKIEVMMAALDYREQGYNINLFEFWGNVRPVIHTSELLRFLDERVRPRMIAAMHCHWA